MNVLYNVAKKSLLNRKTTTFLTIVSIALSAALLVGIERVRTGAKESFASTVSGVDLIVGARSGSINLLLYTIFRIGNATNNISFSTFEELSEDSAVDWVIPISLGDSHRGFRVVGTNENYFKHFQYAGGQSLEFTNGVPFGGLFEVVVGSDVASELNYKIGDKITLSHGAADVLFQHHDDKPFKIVGILGKTGTPVDNSVHVSLEAISALHADWQDGAPPMPGQEMTPEVLEKMNLRPTDITAFFVRLKSKIEIFNFQRKINDFEEEALSAILPGVSLRELWKTIGAAEQALFYVSILVFIVSLVGMTIALVSTLNERRREMAIFRSVGAKKKFVFAVLVLESALLSAGGIILGVGILYGGLVFLHPLLKSKLGLTVGVFAPSFTEVFYLSGIFVGALLASLVPAWRAYKNTLADGLTLRV